MMGVALMLNTMVIFQENPGVFTFKGGRDQMSLEKKIYLADSSGNAIDSALTKTENSEFSIALPRITSRPYFLVESGGAVYMAAERTLNVEGMNNFRDMGGYAAADGKTVRWGKLYRSDHIHKTTDAGLAYIRKLGIRTIIDYRSADEISKYPNRVIDGGIVSYHLDPAAHTAELSAQFSAAKEDEDRNLVNKITEQKKKGALADQYDIVMAQYHNFVNEPKSQQAFARMLQIAADPSAAPLVQHCRGGKDRTGFGAMLLLGVLGVGRADLIADYMITYENRIERNRVKMDGYKKLTQDADVLAYLYSLIDTKPEFISASIDAIGKEYGGIVEYAKRALNISDETISILKGLYLQ